MWTPTSLADGLTGAALVSDSPTSLLVLMVGLVAILMALQPRPVRDGGSSKATNWLQKAGHEPGNAQARSQLLRADQPLDPLDLCRMSCDGSSRVEVPDQPAVRGTFVPSTGLILSNAAQPYGFENDNCVGRTLILHRPTVDPALDKSGEYPHGSHFRGRKRLWEFRIQFKVKRQVNNLLVGIELENYVPLSKASKQLMGLTVAALRQVAGSDLYHSVGDDPSIDPAPHEKPVFMMPMWASDQLIVTPRGEEPPDLTDPSFASFGTLRADDRRAYVQELSDLRLDPGPTYTFCFWGISQFVDVIKWQIEKIVPFVPIDFNTFCGKPPVYLTLYTLNDAGEREPGVLETRHIQSRKNYFLRLALWSSLPSKRISSEKLRDMVPPSEGTSSGVLRRPQQRKPSGGGTEWMFGCCSGSTRSE